MRRFFVTAALAGSFSAALLAQNAPSQAAALKQQYNNVKNNIMAAADKMAEADYSFQPTMPERNFGGWVAHVADAQMNTCSRVAGSPKQLGAASKTSKADLVAALKESFDACDAVYDGTTDANAGDPIQGGFGGPTTRLASLWGNISHDQECYGTMAVYLRLKNIVPPSTEAMGRGRGGKKQ
jgi:hypothetical protein